MSDYSAAASGIGYLHQQIIYSLFLILDRHEPHVSIRIEGLDDIEVLEKSTLRELLQVKHHLNPNSSLSNRSLDLWKTIGIWSDYAKKNWITLPDTCLTLLTTSHIPENSIAALLRPDSGRNPQRACQLLREEASSCKLTSTALEKLIQKDIPAPLIQILKRVENVKYPSEQNLWETLKQQSSGIGNIEKYQELILSHLKSSRELQKAFDMFMNLSLEQQERLVDSIHILDSSPNITEVIQKIENAMHGVSLEYRQEVRQELQGWWLDSVIEHLCTGSEETIPKIIVENQAASICQKYTVELPEDFEPSEAFDPGSTEWEKERFVRQLRAIDTNEPLRRMAIEYHHRAFEQRTKWRNNGRITFERITKYEQELTDFWKERYYDLVDETENEYQSQLEDLDEDVLKKFGKELYKQIRRCDKKISPNITASYMTQGSYQMLANELGEKKKPRVYWHPKFPEQDNETC